MYSILLIWKITSEKWLYPASRRCSYIQGVSCLKPFHIQITRKSCKQLKSTCICYYSIVVKKQSQYRFITFFLFNSVSPSSMTKLTNGFPSLLNMPSHQFLTIVIIKWCQYYSTIWCFFEWCYFHFRATLQIEQSKIYNNVKIWYDDDDVCPKQYTN